MAFLFLRLFEYQERIGREVYQMGVITEFIAIVSGVLVGEWIARRIDRK